MKDDTKNADFGYGFLVVGVYTETKAFPVCSAEVSVSPSEMTARTGEQFPITVETDSAGYSPPIPLRVTQKRYTEISDRTVKYDFFDVVIRKSGFPDTSVKRIPVFEGVISVKQSELGTTEYM